MFIKKNNYPLFFNFLYTAFFCLSSTIVFSQKNVSVYNTKTDSGYIVYADNREIFPVSVKLNFTTKNLYITQDSSVFLIQPASTRVLTKLIVEDFTKAYSFKFGYKTFLGNISLSQYDTNFIYHLPFTKGNSYKLHQGYNGSFSHQNENALDFTMPIGSEVTAARAGIVIQVIDNNNENCLNISCMDFNNYITILHEDGTYAKYVHLSYKGSKVKVGDVVKQDDIIALSGNTGFSSGPHLHFEVNIPSEKKNTVITLFKLDDSTKGYHLQEGIKYEKNY